MRSVRRSWKSRGLCNDKHRIRPFIIIFVYRCTYIFQSRSIFVYRFTSISTGITSPRVYRFTHGRFVPQIPFCVLRSAFCVLRSAFCVLRSAFCVLRSADANHPISAAVLVSFAPHACAKRAEKRVRGGRFLLIHRKRSPFPAGEGLATRDLWPCAKRKTPTSPTRSFPVQRRNQPQNDIPTTTSDVGCVIIPPEQGKRLMPP